MPNSSRIEKTGDSLLETQQYFYDTQVPGTDFYATSFWDNLCDGLTGQRFLMSGQYKLEGFQVVALPDTPIDILANLAEGKFVLSLPVSACLQSRPGSFKLSGVEMRQVSAKIENTEITSSVTLIMKITESYD